MQQLRRQQLFLKVDDFSCRQRCPVVLVQNVELLRDLPKVLHRLLPQRLGRAQVMLLLHAEAEHGALTCGGVNVGSMGRAQSISC